MTENNNNPPPLESAFEAAQKFTNPLARSLLLGELAKVQYAAGLFEEAWRSIEAIPNRMEKKGVLLHLALDDLQANRTERLAELVRKIVDADPNSESTAGRLALSLLEQKNVDAVLLLLSAVEKPFDSERSRYTFFEKLVELDGERRLDEVRKFASMFSDENYRDWSRLAIMKLLAKTGSWPEAKRMADEFSQDRRRSWAFLELARIVEGKTEQELRSRLLERSAEILEAVDVTTENIETVATQLRLLGKSAYRMGETELGARLLERCEAEAAKITLPMPRFRAQYLLARSLRELGLIADVTDYLNAMEIRNEKLSGLQRSLVFQWLAEAERNGEKTWNLAVWEAAREGELPGGEFPKAERLAEIVRRYGIQMRNEKPTPTGDPELDAVNLSAEEFEDYYFSPFAIDDCGC